MLGDMVTDSLITADDVEAERDVILDEIAMHDDDPDDVVHNLFASQACGDSPLGRPIAGTVDSIAAMTPRADRRGSTGATTAPTRWWWPSPATSTTPPSCARCARRSAATASSSGDRRPRVGRGQRPRPPGAPPARARPTRPFEQVNLVLGVKGLTRTDPRRFALGVLNTALGGGTSSRLFQEVREVRGLAYSVFSFASHYADAGVVGVSVGCLPAKLDDVLATVHDELRQGRRRRHHRGGADRGKGQLAAGSCSAWRTPARGCRGSARPSSSTTSCSASTRCWPGSTRSPLEDVAALAREAVLAAPGAGGRRGPTQS